VFDVFASAGPSNEAAFDMLSGPPSKPAQAQAGPTDFLDFQSAQITEVHRRAR
jgi:hypothetical protein